MPSLRDAFITSLGAHEFTAEIAPELESRLAALAEKGEEAWPGVQISRVELARELARAVGALSEDLLARLDAIHASDFYLACACARGDAVALRALDAHFFPAIERYVAAVHPSPQFAEEVRQDMREALLLPGPDRAPKIADYTGRGPLGGWLRVVAVRRALNLRRGSQRAGGRDEELPCDLPSAAPDPELDYLKALYRREFHEAFVAALARLDAQERNALRLHHLDGLTLEEAALLCRVSRATVARLLARARDQIMQDTLRLLRERLRLDDSAMSSVLRLVESQLDFSIQRYLADDAATEAV